VLPESVSAVRFCFGRFSRPEFFCGIVLSLARAGSLSVARFSLSLSRQHSLTRFEKMLSTGDGWASSFAELCVMSGGTAASPVCFFLVCHRTLESEKNK
jgi:hypothetical protein